MYFSIDKRLKIVHKITGFSRLTFRKFGDFEEKLKFYFRPETYRSKLLQSTANMCAPAMNARVGVGRYIWPMLINLTFNIIMIYDRDVVQY